MKKIVVLTGAGISAESGLKTFRDSDGLWENYKVEDIATADAIKRNPELVLNFYNERRKQLYTVKPNDAHISLAKLEDHYDVQIITQNVDDLHERGGSTKILHLHGELKKSRSSINSNLIYDIEGDINVGDLCEDGSQLRPHIVFFGEDVPLMIHAYELVMEADILIIVGTSMQVYPAADLINFVGKDVPIYFIDPNAFMKTPNTKIIKDKATIGVPILVEKLIKNK